MGLTRLCLELPGRGALLPWGTLFREEVNPFIQIVLDKFIMSRSGC